MYMSIKLHGLYALLVPGNKWEREGERVSAFSDFSTCVFHVYVCTCILRIQLELLLLSSYFSLSLIM